MGILNARVMEELFTYENFEDIDLIDKSCIIFELFLLDGLYSILLVALSVLGQVDNAEAAIG